MDKVSVVIPVYNCEKYIHEAIESVIAQSYLDWELIAVDDGSTDGSSEILDEFSCDPRIHVIHQENGGVAAARNAGIELCSGRYIAFLDADDIWCDCHKLEKQLRFMKRRDVGMCFSSYETISENGVSINVVHVPDRIDYKGFLKNTITCSHTVVFDTQRIARELLMAPTSFPDKDFPEDLSVWLQVLKEGYFAYGLDDVLAQYRKRRTSRSSNKLHAVRRTWNQYRYREELHIPYACYCLFWQLFHASMKRL
ncbi:glycosyltransferase [Adlercreutzia caecimuris]|nr:glycosyltransferase [Adlercreutzia caecimuris]